MWSQWWTVAVSVLLGVVLLWLALALSLWLAKPDDASLRDAMRLLPDVLRLLKRLAADPAMPKAVRIWLMLLFVVSGGTGIALHYLGNAEFEREMYPAMAGTELIGKTLTGATPVFAPGTMVLLGGVGLVASYKVRQ